MNENLNTTVVDPFMDPRLTEEQLVKLLAIKPKLDESVDGKDAETIGYVTSDENEGTAETLH